MIDWLLRPPRETPGVEVGGRTLPVELIRSPRARRLTMRLSGDGSTVRITMPRWGRSAEALAFARSRADWLERQLAALPAPLDLRDGACLPYRGTGLTLRHAPERPRRVVITDGELRLGGAAESLGSRLTRWLKAEARRLIAADLADYCARAGLAPASLMLTNARRRWGSCSGKGTIRINWRLVMAPDAVRRSVVAHEVAHLVHFDHSPRFHALLAELYEGDLDAANRWLKTQGRSLYVPLG